MSNQYHIDRLEQAKRDIQAAIQAKGVAVPDTALIDIYPGYIDQIVSDDSDAVLSQLLSKTITSIASDATTTLGAYAFYGCTVLQTADFPNVRTMGTYVFSTCNALERIHIPQCTQIGAYSFNLCTSLKEIDAPLCTILGANAFASCRMLTTVKIGAVIAIQANTFNGCNALSTLVLQSTTVTTLANVNAFTGTLIASGTGRIYVPADLVDAYKAAANWSNYAGQIVSIDTLP